MSEELKDKMYQKLSLYSSELEDRIEDLEKLNTTITMENERLINEIKKLEKDNQTLMNSIVTEAHTKETKEIERLNNIINELEKYLNEQVDYMTHHSIERMVAFDCCRHKLQELKGR